ncbi:MAG: hypothetical protein GY906_37845 [bacterium]|nr:hypothetical protein [bacterium]
MNSENSDSLENTAPEVEREKPRFELVLVRACVVSMWADGTMAASERDSLSQIIASVVRTQRERDDLRQLAMQDLNRHQVLQEVEQLEPTERLHLFDRCFDILKSDHKIKRLELRFLQVLRKSCGVGYWAFQKSIFRLIPLYRRVLLTLLAVALVATALMWRPYQSVPIFLPQEADFHPQLLIPPAPQDLPILESEELFQTIRRSVVTVHVLVDGQRVAHGSGAVIGIDAGRSSYFVVTNRHVIYHLVEEGQTLSFEAEFENGARFEAILDYYSRPHDLALLSVVGTPLWAQVVALAKREELSVGQPVYALGSPVGLRHTFTSGVISALRSNSIQTDATVHSGSSGGPLIDERGLVCGVVTSTHITKDFSFALYADAILEMLEARQNAPPQEESEAVHSK